VIVVGPPGCGKSSIIKAMIDNRNLSGCSERNDGNSSQHHRLLRFFPLATDDLTHIFGSVDATGKWRDGALTAAWKKAIPVSLC